MPAEAPVAPPPAASNALPPPPPAPPPKGEIHLTAPTQTASDQGPVTPPKKGSAMDRLQQDLRKRAKPQFFEPNEETHPAAKTEERPAASTPENQETESGTPQGGTAPSDGQQPPAAAKDTGTARINASKDETSVP